jgi:hypothetical protein
LLILLFILLGLSFKNAFNALYSRTIKGAMSQYGNGCKDTDPEELAIEKRFLNLY